MKKDEINYFLEWRANIWKPAIQWLVGEENQFVGKRVLDLGCRSGKMACYFGLLGAVVTGIDLPSVDMSMANHEAIRWNVQDSVVFKNYHGDPLSIERNEYDFIFTKSVLVIVPRLDEFLEGIMGSLKIGGKLISAENRQVNPTLTKVIALISRTKLRQKPRFHGVDKAFLGKIERVFNNVEARHL